MDDLEAEQHTEQARAAERRAYLPRGFFHRRERRTPFDRRARVDLPSYLEAPPAPSRPARAKGPSIAPQPPRHPMAKALEILVAALLIAAGAAVYLFTRPLQFSFEEYPIYPVWAGWPRDAVALALGIAGVWVATGSWGGNPETRPALVFTIVGALAAVFVYAISQIHFHGF